ncbi:alpha/beta hydrolase [Streptomyces sp. 8K308]|uniref:alpha/beta fold hydrolase n=1 Tax=Streptomyces sp. 8K308 TaxID=2530388 RepID=UPI00104FA723|nr:alpha/beta hydrolase [Streptomyces sp. 8K308]TDC20690.1 alpha/beta hydrolase [Streptomyces sp. 8K308]
MARCVDVAGHGGVRLAAWEFTEAGAAGATAGERPGVLLLHGLMGRAQHWASAAGWLSRRYRAVALDQRGHGRSEKPGSWPLDRDVFVADAEAVIERLGLGRVAVIGHAMGALIAWRLAARRPDLVRALVICDMRAAALGAVSQRELRGWLSSWPLPFASRAAARRWFGEEDPSLERPNPARGEFFAAVMAKRADGWRPGFSRRQVLIAREGFAHDAHWDELAGVSCPTLVIRGVDGVLGRAEAQEMVRVLPAGRYADIPDAGHLAHLERPHEWRAIVEPFLTETAPLRSA